MPNRQLTGAEGYRYGYQGDFAETDPETGKPAFELRLYDPRINRWLTTDPAGQYHSPYLAMGNNWINKIDPDGGFDWYVNNETGELEWHNTSGSIDGLTWVGTNSASHDYLSSIGKLFGGSGKISFSDIASRAYYDITNGFNSGLEQRGKDFVSFMEDPVGRTLQGVANFVDGAGSFINDFVASGEQDLGFFAMSRAYDTASNMTLYDWSYAIGYSTPDITLGFVGGYALSSLRFANGIKVGNVRLLTNFNNKLEGTLLQIGRGKNFRIDFDWRNGLHYHRRGPGGIGRHRPWQVKPGDQGNFWKRF